MVQAIADEAGLPLATLALAWCRSRWYVTSTVIGFSNKEQLAAGIDAFEPDLQLSKGIIDAIDEVYLNRRDPCMAVEKGLSVVKR